MKKHWAVIATKNGRQALCGVFEAIDDAKIRWWDVVNLLDYEDAEIKSISANNITKFKNFEVRFPESGFSLERNE